MKCSIRNFESHGQRLMSEWKTPSKGLGDFWKRLEENELAQGQSKRQPPSIFKDGNKQLQRMANEVSVAAFDGTVGGDVLTDTTQVIERQDDLDEDSDADADNLSSLLSRHTAITPTVSVEISKPEDISIQNTEAVLRLLPTIYYLAGGGDPNCSSERRSPYMVNGADFSDILWDYRSEVLEKAESMDLLEIVERLDVNNMYLFEQNDIKSSHFHALGAKHWSVITSNTLKTKVSKELLSEIGRKAVEISRMTHEDAQYYVDHTSGNKEFRRLLRSFEDDFLWHKANFNELELIEQFLNPFLKTFFRRMPSYKGRWDAEFGPSKCRRRMDDPTAKGRRPDYFMELIHAGLTCYLIVLKAKKSRQTSQIQTDTEKVAQFLKDSIDQLARATVDVSREKATVYIMELAAKGAYIMKE
ncbi:hypothetical protein FBU30_000769 [Linnemannia zychae]|nr:hypothetical protein FBU30_000769 [Linnemannia zychae]